MLDSNPNTNRTIKSENYHEISHRKLLNSHLSIYNALTNPDLEMSPDLSDGLSRFPSPINSSIPGSNLHPKSKELMDESWQNLSNESIFHNHLIRTLTDSPNLNYEIGRPSSLLLMTTDEDVEEVELIVSRRDGTMVFETDEEDEDDFPHSSFIMPKVSVNLPNINLQNVPLNTQTNNPPPLTVTLLSSCEVSYETETNQLINSINSELNGNINMIHLSLELKSIQSHLSEELIRNSNLIFIVNDGSSVFIEFFNKLSTMEDSMPKLTVINIMTFNYFVNLFDLIQYLKPYQIWKAPSLNQQALITKFKTFLNYELDNCLNCKVLSKDLKRNLEKEFNKNDKVPSVYSSIIPTKRPNYKHLEKKYKAELLESQNSIDPLNLNLRKLSCFNAVYTALNQLMGSRETNTIDNSHNSSNLYMITSFLIGVSLGVGITSGLAKLFTVYISDGLFTLNDTITPTEIVKETSSVDTVLNKVMEDVGEIIGDCSQYLSSFLSGLRQTSSFMVDAARGGFEKVLKFLF